MSRLSTAFGLAVRGVATVASVTLAAAHVHLLTDEQLDDMLDGEKVDGILLGMRRRRAEWAAIDEAADEAIAAYRAEQQRIVAEIDADLARGPVGLAPTPGGTGRGRVGLANGWTLHSVAGGAV